MKEQEAQIRVSIITVVHDARDDLEKTIASMAAQIRLAGPSCEYVIVDGGSTDGTVDVIKSNLEIVDHWISEPDQGIYDAMNKGIRASRGSAILLLNAGDVLLEGALDALIAAARKDAIVYFDYFRERAGKRKFVRTTGRLVPGMKICHQATLIGRSVHEKVGFYNRDMKLAADYEFLLRCRKQKIPFLKIDIPLVNFHYGGVTVQQFGASYRETIQAAWHWLPPHLALITTVRFGMAFIIKKFIYRPKS